MLTVKLMVGTTRYFLRGSCLCPRIRRRWMLTRKMLTLRVKTQLTTIRITMIRLKKPRPSPCLVKAERRSIKDTMNSETTCYATATNTIFLAQVTLRLRLRG